MRSKILLILSFAIASPIFAQSAAKPAAPTVDFPGFKVQVTYSAKAQKLLTDKKETVKMAAYLTGTPKKGALKKYISEMDEVNLGEADAEVAVGATFNIPTIKIKKDAFDQTDGQSPQVNINVFSGRKSSPNNLIDCGDYEGTLKEMQGKTIPFTCKVIGE